MGNWIQTFTGKRFDPLNATVDDVCIEDIAHALGMICRYGGHSQWFYSVAEHSVLVSQLCETYPLDGLMHDATEAYIGDVCRPIKPLLGDYKIIEANLHSIIAAKFGVCEVIPDEVNTIDFNILANEKKVCMQYYLDWHYVGELIPNVELKFLNPIKAEAAFLQRFHELAR